MKKLEPYQKELLRLKLLGKGIDTIETQEYILEKLGLSIENIWAENPDKDLDTAYQEVYASYGKMGFASFLDESQAQTQQNISKIFKASLLECLQIVPSLISLAVFVIIFGLSFFYANKVAWIVAGVVIVGVFFWRDFNFLSIFRSPYALVRHIFAINILLIFGVIESQVIFEAIKKLFQFSEVVSALGLSSLIFSNLFLLYLLNFKVLPKALEISTK